MVRVVGKFYKCARELTEYCGNGLLFQVHDTVADDGKCWLHVYADDGSDDDGSDDAPRDIIQCFGSDARQRILQAVERYLSYPAPVFA